ncbi:MAG: hypothetical protein ACRDRR_09505 [Pseudonocardiaceae bacterium]
MGVTLLRPRACPVAVGVIWCWKGAYPGAGLDVKGEGANRRIVAPVVGEARHQHGLATPGNSQ